MITVTITSPEEIAVAIEEYNVHLHESLRRCMQRIGIMLQRYIVAEKLSGQVLNRRSGKLANSVNQKIEDDGVNISAQVSAGANAPYAAVHEYGGTFQIPEHMSMSRTGNSFIVKSHAATYRERSFMRSSLAENEAKYTQMIDQAVAEAMNR